MSDGKQVVFTLPLLVFFFGITSNFKHSHSTLTEIRSSLLNLPAYAAHEDFQSYLHWIPLDGRDSANQLVDKDDNLASIVVIGQIMRGRLAVAPLGNYQNQEEKNSYEENSSKKIACKDAKMVVYLRRPTSYPDWLGDYDIATSRLDRLQEAIASTKAPRQWFLEQAQKPGQDDKIFILKLNHVLWQKKQINGTDALDGYDDDDDDDMKDIREEERDKAQETSTYANIVSDRFKSEYNIVKADHHIRPPPVFLMNGRRINPGTLEARLPDALVEVVFTLRHFHIGGSKSSKPSYGKTRSQPESHTFTAAIEHIKILQTSPSKNSISSPLRMKVLPKSPMKGKEIAKRANPDHPEPEETVAKKQRLETSQSTSSVASTSKSDSSDTIADVPAPSDDEIEPLISTDTV